MMKRSLVMTPNCRVSFCECHLRSSDLEGQDLNYPDDDSIHLWVDCLLVLETSQVVVVGKSPELTCCQLSL